MGRMPETPTPAATGRVEGRVAQAAYDAGPANAANQAERQMMPPAQFTDEQLETLRADRRNREREVDAANARRWAIEVVLKNRQDLTIRAALEAARSIAVYIVTGSVAVTDQQQPGANEGIF